MLEVVNEGSIGGANAGGLTLGGGELLTSSNATFSEGVTLNAGTDTLAAVTNTTATYTGTFSGTGSLAIGDGANDGTVNLTNGASGFNEIKPTAITIASGATLGLFGYIDQNGTTITGAANSTLKGFTPATSGNGSDTPLFIYNPDNETASGAGSATDPGTPNYTSYTVSVSGVTITGGVSQGGSGIAGGAGLGGGAFVGAGATLVLSDVDVMGNSANGGNGGNDNGGAGSGGIGGDSVNNQNEGGGLFTDNGIIANSSFGGGSSALALDPGFGGGALGGTGGFGGGGGGIDSPVINDPGCIGGGEGAIYDPIDPSGDGGGGAGFGGGLFVQNGATVIVTGNSTISSNTVEAGTGYTDGAAAGADIFMMSGSSVTLAPGTGNTVTIGDAADNTNSISDIADDTIYSIPSGQGYTAGNAVTSDNPGGILNIGNSEYAGGTVVLYGNNTYAGGTVISNGATLEVSQDSNLGTYDSSNSLVGNLTLDGGKLLTNPTLNSTNTFTTARGVILDPGVTNTLAASNGTTATYSGTFSGSGSSKGPS